MKKGNRGLSTPDLKNIIPLGGVRNMSDMDESIRKALAIQEATNAFHENLQLSNIAKIAKIANQNDEMIKAALGQAMQSAGISSYLWARQWQRQYRSR